MGCCDLRCGIYIFPVELFIFLDDWPAVRSSMSGGHARMTRVDLRDRTER
jgi:hypothetical protein